MDSLCRLSATRNHWLGNHFIIFPHTSLFLFSCSLFSAVSFCVLLLLLPLASDQCNSGSKHRSLSFLVCILSSFHLPPDRRYLSLSLPQLLQRIHSFDPEQRESSLWSRMSEYEEKEQTAAASLMFLLFFL